MTNREFFTAIVSANVSDEITEFAKSALVKLDKKNEISFLIDNIQQNKPEVN